MTGTLLVPTAALDGRSALGRSSSFAPARQGLGDGCAPSKSHDDRALLRAVDDRRPCSTRAGPWPSPTTRSSHAGRPHLHRQARRGPRRARRRARRQRAARLGLRRRRAGRLSGATSRAARPRLLPPSSRRRYAPELQRRGTVAGGVPVATSPLVAAYLDGPSNFCFAILAFAAVGLDSAYPELNLESYLNAPGREPARAGPQRVPRSTGCSTARAAHRDLTTTNPLTTPAWRRGSPGRSSGVRAAAHRVPVPARSTTSSSSTQGTTLRTLVRERPRCSSRR